MHKEIETESELQWATDSAHIHTEPVQMAGCVIYILNGNKKNCYRQCSRHS